MLAMDLPSRWSPRTIWLRVSKRMGTMVKRRLRGESRRQWLERNLKDSEAGVIFDVLQCIFCLLMVRSIIAQNWSGSSFKAKTTNSSIDIANLIAITINFGIRFYAASNRREFCRHWLSLVDICCWIPLMVETVTPKGGAQENNKYVFRLFLMVRTARILQVYRLLRLAKTAKTRQGVLIGLTAICIIICAAATFQTIEFCDPQFPWKQDGINCQDLSFFDSIYFVCITIGTVGYGELAPKSQMGKVTSIFLIIFTGVLIPTQISGYTDILSRETAFDRKYTPDKRIQHVLLCGDIDNASLTFFLHNWLYGDSERNTRRKVIILSPNLPSPSVHRILIHRDYEQSVLYLQGSAMDTSDLMRAGAPSATFCFVMVKKHSEHLTQNDTATNLVTCSVRKNNRHAPLFVQVSKVDNIRHIDISGASAIVCVEQLKLGLFAKSLWIKGLNAFLGNLVQRFLVPDESEGFWLSDYIRGCSHRIYEAPLPSFLFAMPTFRSLAILLYREFGIPVVGVRTLHETVLIYPVDKDMDEIGFHSVLFLATSRDMISKIEKLSSSVFHRHSDISPNVDAAAFKSSRSVTKVLTSMTVAAKEATNFFPFRNSSSVVLSSAETARGSVKSIHRQSGGRAVRKNSIDKITPLNRDDDVCDSARNHSNLHPTLLDIKAAHTSGNAMTRHPSSIHGDEEEDIARETLQSEVDATEFPPVKPVVALSPAELLKKAAGPLSPRDRSLVITPRALASPRRDNTAGGAHRDPNHLSPRQSPGSPRRGTVSATPRTQTPTTTEPSPSSCPPTAKQPLTEGASPRHGRVSFVAEREADGPTVEAVDAARPPPITTKQDVEDCDEDEEGDVCSPSDIAPPSSMVPSPSRPRSPSKLPGATPLRRQSEMSPTKRYQYNRSSQYRSFKRKPPPVELGGHYVICGIPSNYHALVASLSDLDEQLVGVVFVTPRELSENEFNLYMQNKNVYFVRGSPVSIEVFEEARMIHAKGILIMSYCGGESEDTQSSSEQLDENMADVDAITTHRFICEACHNLLVAQRQRHNSIHPRARIPFIVVEMMRPSNVKFLAEGSSAMYDERSALNEARTKELLKDTKAIDEAFFSPLYAGGHIYFTNLLDGLLGSSAHSSFLIDTMTLLIISGNSSASPADRDARSSNRLTQIVAPARYHNRPYALMVEGLLVNENTMTLGIYRAEHGFVAPAYVFTNPPANEIVQPHDLLFVIK